jgi:hypothetical protein
MRARIYFLLAVFACGTAGAADRWEGWDYEFDQEKKPWTELQAQLPPYPAAQNLVPFEAGGASPHRFFIDAPSLTIGKDGVVRYTLVIKTAGGATNVSFEGMRCDMQEQKTYAFGHADGKWSRARDPQWRRVVYQEINRQYGVLFKDFFCADKAPQGTSAQILEKLRYNSGYVRGGGVSG